MNGTVFRKDHIIFTTRRKKMTIKFSSNKINLSSGTFDSFVKKVLSKNDMTKQASSEEASVEETVEDVVKEKVAEEVVEEKVAEEVVAVKVAEEEDKEDKEDKEEVEVKVEEKEEKEEKKASSAQFVKVAKLNSETKAWLKDYWRNLYPEAYVEAMLAGS